MQYVGIKDHDGTVAGVDDISGYLVQISEIHAQIHEGQFFTSTVVDTSVADSGTLEILMLTNGSVPHARFTAQSGGNSRLEIFEDTTVSANGSALVAQNRNRLSANTATALVYSGPTVTGDGTKIFDKSYYLVLLSKHDPVYISMLKNDLIPYTHLKDIHLLFLLHIFSCLQ